MPETLLSASTVLLYGRVLEDVALNVAAPPPPVPAPPPLAGGNFLSQRLQGAAPPHDAQLARIYAFSFEGHYYDLARPAIFLVHGPGDDPEAPRLPNPRDPRAPADADRTGVARQAGAFADDMRVWAYDKDDFSIRMDVETGSFAQILLDAALRPDQQQASYSGAESRLRLSGAESRLRMSGAETRLRGGRGD